MNAWLVAGPILLPLISAGLTLALRRCPRAQARLALVASLGQVAVSVLLLLQVLRQGVLQAVIGNWPLPAGIALQVDELSAILLVVTSTLLCCTVAYRAYNNPEPDHSRTWQPLMQLLVAGVGGAFLTGDLFNLYVWFEVLLISSFVLLAVEGKGPGAQAATLRYVLLNLLGSALFLSGLGILYGATGSVNMDELAALARSGQLGGEADLAAVLLASAFALKAGIFPVHAWLPAAYPQPSHATSGLFAGLLTKVGVYALIRLDAVLLPQANWLSVALGALALPTMLFGVLGAACQMELRRILSFHVISQVGYMVLGLAIGTPLALAGTVFYLAHHIVVKTSLFLVSGTLARASGSESVERIDGLARSPQSALALAIPALSLAGMPPLSGAIAKLAIIMAAFQAGWYVAGTIALITGLFTLFSMLKILDRALLAPLPAGSRPARAAWPLLVLAAWTLILGLAAGPVFSVCERAAQRLAAHTSSAPLVAVEVVHEP